MNRIILIGNGFDLAHGLKTSYANFIDWFWEQQLDKINQIKNTSEEWELISNSLEDTHYEHKRNDFFVVKYNRKIDFISKELIEKQNEIAKVENVTEKRESISMKMETVQPSKFNNIDELKQNVVYKNKFLEIIEKRRKLLKNWADIEELYFQILTNCKNRIKDENVYEIYTVEQLNCDFRAIKLQLESFIKTRNDVVITNSEYITSVTKEKGLVQKIQDIIKDGITDKDNVLLLNFNYSNTVSEFYHKKINGITTDLIHIHGEASKPNENPMIVGYGDEVADDSVEIEKLNNNDFLENVKSIKYVETNNYSEFLKFIEKSKEYDVFVFGHSCGNSDRTLLKALFERENCKKIRCFYYKRTEKSDDFNATVDNIYRKFEDKTDFRKKMHIKEKEDAFPQYGDYGVTIPVELQEKPKTESDKQEETTEQIQTTTKEKTEEKKYIDVYNMVNVEFDANSKAYKNIDDEITSKKQLKSDFYIGKYPVTQKEWQDIMVETPSWFSKNGVGKKEVEKLDTGQFPVESVSWYDCISFCNKLSEIYNLSKYYNISGSDVTTNEDAKGFRLPTEAEWEYAARGGKKTQNKECSGCDMKDLKNYAWYYENSGDKELKDDEWNVDKLENNNCRTHKVGDKNPNELGLYDMSGNVWEWCEDWYNSERSRRVLRGGGWYNSARVVRVSSRFSFFPVYRYYYYGFRLALSSK
jgi:formylglycine-generating enzyme required for sulfatase activity